MPALAAADDDRRAPSHTPSAPSGQPTLTRARDGAILVAVAAALAPVLWPLTAPGLAATHDGFLHVQRIIAIESMARQGGPFLRWLPDLAYGYGQPLLLYYAPLSYVPALFARLLGAGYVASFELSGGLAVVLAALAMFLFARALVGPVAAGVAAVVYATLPYQMVDLYVRGALAESWAFVWLPICAWTLMQSWNGPDARPRWSVGLALALAGLILTHNVTALLYLPALLVLAVLLQARSGRNWRAAPPRPLIALATGLSLSAWFWAPALLERGFVQISETIEPALFASYFVRSWPPFRLDLLYDYEQPVSTALGSPIFWPQLGLIQAVVTLAGAGALYRLRGPCRTVGLWALILAVGSYAMQLGPMAAMYDAVPLLAFVQFPWRLLAILGLGSALLAGLLVERLRESAPAHAIIAALVVTASITTAVARLNPESVPVSDALLSVESITRAELAEYGLGTTHSGEYLPVTSGQRNAARLRKTILDAGGGSERRDAQPAEMTVHAVRWRADRIVLDVDAPVAERLVVQQFAFPGWGARIDGETAVTVASGPLGVLAVDVPPGQHRVEFAWGWTPTRMAAASVSVLSILLVVFIASPKPRRPEPRRILLGFAIMGLVVSLVNPAERDPYGTVADAPVARTADPARGPLSLLSTAIDATRLEQKRVMIARLVWQVRQAPTTGYRASIEAVAADGTIHRAPWVHEPLSRLWDRGSVVPTTVALRLPTDFPAGTADLQIVFDRPDGLGPFALGTLDVPVGHGPAATGDGEHAIGDAVRVRASEAAGEIRRVRAGAVLDIEMQWRAVAAPADISRELLVVAVLTTPGGDVISPVRRPGDWFAPLPFWQTGDLISQNVRLTVPASVPAGSYPLTVRVYPRDLARGGMSEPGASEARIRGRPIAELPLGNVEVLP